METVLYLAKVNAYWLIFYVCYWLLLRKHTFFHWNRFYLLGSLLIAFALPAIHFAAPVTTIYVPETVYQKATISVAVIADKAPEASMNGWTWVVGLYTSIALALMWKFVTDIVRLLKMVGAKGSIWDIILWQSCPKTPAIKVEARFHSFTGCF